MKKIILISLAIILGTFGYFGYQMLYPKSTPKLTEDTLNKQVIYTLAQIREHSTKVSCWLAIEGLVYDVTPFVKSGFHPGKDAILEGCGKDATDLFNTRPMGSKTAHSDKARSNLPKYLIGELAK